MMSQFQIYFCILRFLMEENAFLDERKPTPDLSTLRNFALFGGSDDIAIND